MKTTKIELTGQTLYKLLVVQENGRSKSGSVLWLCQCICGHKVTVSSDQLRGGKRKSCGCWKEGISTNAEDMVGRKFNALTILKKLNYANNQSFWLCQCDCGKKVEVRGGNLISGNTRSCGCRRGKSHGLSSSPEYQSWSCMKARCLNRNNKSYEYYGGRGITVCPQWINSFEQFYLDVGSKPDPTFSLDRIDSNGHYEPGNVRWASPQEQWDNRKQINLTMKSYQYETAKEYRAEEISVVDAKIDCSLELNAAIGKLTKSILDNKSLAEVKRSLISSQKWLSRLATEYEIDLSALMMQDLLSKERP